MFKYKLILLLVLTALVSCNKNNVRLDDYFTDLPCENVLGTKIHDFDSIEGSLFRLYSGNKYTISESVYIDNSYELMDNSAPGKFTQFVKLGRGPYEVIGGGIGCFLSDTVFCSMSINGDQKLDFYNLNDVIKDPLTKPFNQIDVKANGAIRLSTSFFITDDSIVVGCNHFNDSLKLIATFDLKTNKSGNYVECPLIDNDNFLKSKNSLLAGDMKYNTQRDKFVFNSFNGDMIYFCEVNSNGEVKVVKNYVLTAPEYVIDSEYGAWPTKDKFLGSKFIAHKGDKFYVQYIGKPYRQVMKEQNVDQVLDANPNTVLVFDEDGNPVCKYMLDKEAINIFQYKKSIIAMVNEGGEEVFYQYDI